MLQCAASRAMKRKRSLLKSRQLRWKSRSAKPVGTVHGISAHTTTSVRRSAATNAKTEKSSSKHRASERWLRLVRRKDFRARHSTALKNISTPNMVSSFLTRHIQNITSNLVKFLHIRRDTRKMAVSSATTILGSSSVKFAQDAHRTLGNTPRRLHLATTKTSAKSTAPNLMSTHR